MVAATVAATVVAAVGLSVAGEYIRLRNVDRALTKAEHDLVFAPAAALADATSEVDRLLGQRNPLAPAMLFGARRNRLENRYSDLIQNHVDVIFSKIEESADVNLRSVLGDSPSLSPRVLAGDPMREIGLDAPGDWDKLATFAKLSPQALNALRQEVTELLILRALSLAPAAGASGAERAAEEDVSLRASAIGILHSIPEEFRASQVVDSLVGEWDDHEFYQPAELAHLTQVAKSDFEGYLVALVASERGDFAQARDLMHGLVESNSLSTRQRFWARFVWSFCCHQLGQREEAIFGYSVCVGLENESPWAHHNLGLLFIETGVYSAAIERFEWTISLAPELPSAHANLGAALFQSERFDEALVALDRAKELSTQQYEALGLESVAMLNNRAAVLEALGRADEALAELNQVLVIDPDNDVARKNLRRLNR
jgi:tetratricopeptide (TPR) repeat protein